MGATGLFVFININYVGTWEELKKKEFKQNKIEQMCVLKIFPLLIKLSVHSKNFFVHVFVHEWEILHCKLIYK